MNKKKPPRKFMCYDGPHSGHWKTWEEVHNLESKGFGYNQYNNSGGYGPSAIFVWVKRDF